MSWRSDENYDFAPIASIAQLILRRSRLIFSAVHILAIELVKHVYEFLSNHHPTISFHN